MNAKAIQLRTIKADSSPIK